MGIPRLNPLFSALEQPEIRESRVVQCLCCSLIYAYPMPNFPVEILARMYSQGYFQEYTPKWHRIRNVENPRRRFQKALDALGRPVQRYLEVGAGEGYGLEVAREMGWEVFGQDISLQFAEQVKKRLGITLQLGILNSETYPKGHFDFIYMDSVLEHVSDPINFMEILKGYLAPGGVLYVVLPNEDSLPNFFKDSLFKLFGSKYTSRICPFDDSYHLLGFSPRSIRFLAKQIDLDILWLSCRSSFMHIEKFRYGGGLLKYTLRRIIGLIYLACDCLDDGINLEVLFRDKS